MKNSQYPHLGKLAISQIDMSDDERIKIIKEGSWISYTRANEILDQMEELFNHPRILRMPNMLLVGASNNGKTQILRHFEEKHKPDPNPNGEYSIIPVLFVEGTKKPDINGLTIFAFDGYNRWLLVIVRRGYLLDCKRLAKLRPGRKVGYYAVLEDNQIHHTNQFANIGRP